MKKAELKEIMKQYCIVDCELNDVCDFVSEMLHRRARELEAAEPYATNTIKKLDDAAYEAYDLIDYLEEIMNAE